MFLITKIAIMFAFFTNSIDTPGVINRVSQLFHGHPDLVLGFNAFLPPGYRIEIPKNGIAFLQSPFSVQVILHFTICTSLYLLLSLLPMFCFPVSYLVQCWRKTKEKFSKELKSVCFLCLHMIPKKWTFLFLSSNTK